jgi:outer membrane protein
MPQGADYQNGISKEFFNQMKRLLALAITLASGLTLNATAQTASAPAATAGSAKIAVIAFQLAVAQTNEGQRDFSDLQKKYEPKKQQLKALNDEVESLEKQLTAQGDKLSDTEKTSRNKTIEDKKKQLTRDQEDAQSDYQSEMQTVYNALATKVYDVLTNYVQQQGYSLVLDVSQTSSPVLFASESTNITKAVIEAYNQKSGIPAPATTSSSSSTTTKTPATTKSAPATTPKSSGTK